MSGNSIPVGKIDDRYIVTVERCPGEPLKGKLMIRDGDSVVAQEETTITAGAVCGPDAQDQQEWLLRAIEMIDGSKASVVMKDEVPYEIFFFPNGQTAVTNRAGEQIGKYQDRHAESVRLMAADNIDWRSIAIIHGAPDGVST